MYLALIPDDKSTEAIRRAVPAAGELHLTVIHSRAELPPIDDAFRAYQAHVAKHGVYAAVLGTIRVGPTGRRLWALGLVLSSGLHFARNYAENALCAAGMNWSAGWPFSPHITLCAAPALSLADELPAGVLFNRLDWRA